MNEYMKLYEYQRSRSFIDIGPRHPDSTFSNLFFFETARPIEVTFYVEPLSDGGSTVFSNGLGHATNMADMPIYSKNLKQSSSLEPKCR